MRRRGLAIAATSAVLAVVATFSMLGQSGGAGVPSAKLVGGISYVGGPSAGGGTPHVTLQPGRVIVRTRSGRRVASQQVRRGHRFHFQVAPGRYRLTPHGDNCRRSVRARANRTTGAGIVCQNRAAEPPRRGFRLAWGWGVKNGADRFQTCGPPEAACGAGTNGSGEGQFASPDGVATDRRGNVYVADTFNARIEKFSAKGRFLTKWDTVSLPNSVATDASGHVYVVNDKDQVLKYAQVPPRTTITTRRFVKRRATFRFKSSEPHSIFNCKLDHRPFRPCASPQAYHNLSLGRHTFKVRATDSDKLTDPSPATRAFHVGPR